ncbi:TonB family protein [Billgrantia endophytica]|uniref:TonB C-terminal domain-containing protein n=1 Tax=Billgrantia endophytica TaxID=2033802 RepID=A0A2N7UED0_9GAMM|nr:TonB family protein [Halomonas endophytica]PMR78812.1 hypothetical protein C1H69_00700 [Halomonas endophytica]
MAPSKLGPWPLSMTAGLYLAPDEHGKARVSDAPGSLGLSRAIVLSLALHAGLAAPFLLLDPFGAEPEERDTLLLEVYGMIAERQMDERVLGEQQPDASAAAQQAVEARQAVAEVTPQEAVEPPQEVVEPPQEVIEPPQEVVEPPPEVAETPREVAEPPPPVEQTQDSGPVIVEEEAPSPPPPRQEEVREPPAQPAPQAQPTPPAQAAPSAQPAPPAQPTPPVQSAANADARSGTELQQLQQTISHEEQEANLLREYLRNLRRTVQDNLTYPAEARRAGVEGVPIVSFSITESGDIQPGTLRVTRSSGHRALDESALAAAAASVPFERPRRPMMEVSIAVSFVRD